MIEINFNSDWKFHFETESNKKSEYHFRKISLPHDFSIESERSKDSKMKAKGGFFQGGIGIYEKKFIPKPNLEGKEIFLSIDGAYMNSEIYVNDNLVTIHHYGYSNFWVNISSEIMFQKENWIKIIINNDMLPNSNGYSGSGIFRNVFLYISEKLHIINGETFVNTKYLDNTRAVINVSTKVKNEYTDRKAYGMIITEIEGRDKKLISTGKNIILEPDEVFDFEANLTIENPAIWNINVAQLYTLVNKVIINGKVIDKAETRFGIRTIELSRQEGFKLNGRPMKLKGCCIHHDNGPIGACSYRQAEVRKVELLKQLGYNAVRTVHNPPSREFLDACDRYGMLVVEELFDGWQIRRMAHDYHLYFQDEYLKCVSECINRDKNHPSVIMWSVGNELEESTGCSNGETILKTIIQQIRKSDCERPITSASLTEENYHRISDKFLDQLEVAGCLYGEEVWEKENLKYPDRILCQMASYPNKMAEIWSKIGNLTYIIGDFSWTGFDYLGDAGLGRIQRAGEKQDMLADYPYHISNCGDYDICGFVKPQGEYRRVMWGMRQEPYIGVEDPQNYKKYGSPTKWGWEDIENSWSFPGREGKETKVHIYANADEAELILNGKTVERKEVGSKRSYEAEFEVIYESGILECFTYKNGIKSHKSILATCKAAYEVRLNADRVQMNGNGTDIAYIVCEIVDEDGCVIPYADNAVHITVTGEGVLLGSGNAHPCALNHYQSENLNVYKGRALIVVRGMAQGEIRIRVQADKLKSGEYIISLS